MVIFLVFEHYCNLVNNQTLINEDLRRSLFTESFLRIFFLPVWVDVVNVDRVHFMTCHPLLAWELEAVETAPHVVPVSQVDTEAVVVNLAKHLQELLKNEVNHCK